MLDISITKYLFASILFSALIVSLLEVFTRIFSPSPPVDDKSKDPLIKIVKMDGAEHLIGLGIGAGLLILLIVYILKIEKNISNKNKKNSQ